MSTDNTTPKVLSSFIPLSEQEPEIPQRRRSDRVCALCQLPFGKSQFSVGLRSGRNLHLECYLRIYQRAADTPAA